MKTRRVWPLATVLVMCCACVRSGEDAPRVAQGTPIVLISIDTLRSDRLPVYGYHDVETPAVDRLRSDGVLFERAYTHVPLTLPAHTSLLSGTLPPAHGVRDNLGYTVDPEHTPLLQRRLSEVGYATGGAVSAFVLRRETGIATGFDFYQDGIEVTTSIGLQGIQRPGNETLESVRPWLRSVADRPFFLFFHIFEPHSPYEPPDPFASMYEDAYDGEVAAADAVVGNLLDELGSLGVYEEALIVLLSDHGEGLGEHGEDEHGLLLYRTTLQVPLVVKLPHSMRAGETVTRPVQLVDVYPTVLSILGMEIDGVLPGTSLLASPDAAAEERPIYSETFFPRFHCGWSDLASLIVGVYHYIDSPNPELFDLVQDPGELDNLVDGGGRQADGLAETLAAIDRRLVAPAATDSETRRRLEALGYVGEASVSEGDGLPDPKTRVGVMRELRQAYHLLIEGDPAGAERLYLQILAENPGLEDAWEYLARAQRQMGRHDEALATLAAALEQNPGSPRLSMGAATQLYEMGRLDEAAHHARRGLAHDASAAHELLAQIALQRGDLALAESEARQATSLENRRSGPRLVLADVLVAKGRAADAVEVLESAVSAGIRDESLRRKLAVIYMSGGGIERAEAALAGLEGSSDAETLVLFGRIAGLRQQWDEARRWLERALEIDPFNAAAKINLGVLAAVEGRSREARTMLESGVAEDPRSFEGWNALGMVRANAGDFDGAATAWTRALEIDPRATDLLFNLGLAHAQAGRYARAAEFMESFAETAEGEARERALGLAEQYRRRVRGFGLGIQ